MDRGILELKNDTSILRKNGLFLNKTCCGLAALLSNLTVKQFELALT